MSELTGESGKKIHVMPTLITWGKTEGHDISVICTGT